MLKLLPLTTPTASIKTKCGEIFCQNFSDFTIFCTFCQIKSFQYEDFLLHIQNVHLGNANHKEETKQSEEFSECLEMDIKNETLLTEDKVLWEQDQEIADGCNSENENEDCRKSSASEQEQLMILKSSKIKHSKKKKCKRRQAIKYEEETSSDEQDTKKYRNMNKNISLKDDCEDFSNSKKKSKDLEYSCTECSEIFTQKKFLDQHVVELHNGYKCSLCDKRFRRSYHVTYHLKTHTSEKNFICPMENCRRGFIDEDYLKRHLEVHTMERTFICDYADCGKAFQTHRRLASHKYTHRIPKKFVCDMCGHSCRSNTELTTHQRVHTGEKPFPCGLCSKPFISKTALTEHMISHSDSRPHVCPVCKAAFANRRVLVRHSFIHSEEKTFKCKLCSSAFKHPNSLQGHMRNVHREPKVRASKKTAAV